MQTPLLLTINCFIFDIDLFVNDIQYMKFLSSKLWINEYSNFNDRYIKQRNTNIQNHNSETKEKQDENLSYKEVNAKLDKAAQEQSLRASKQKPSYDEQKNTEQKIEKKGKK